MHGIEINSNNIFAVDSALPDAEVIPESDRVVSELHESAVQKVSAKRKRKKKKAGSDGNGENDGNGNDAEQEDGEDYDEEEESEYTITDHDKVRNQLREMAINQPATYTSILVLRHYSELFDELTIVHDARMVYKAFPKKSLFKKDEKFIVISLQKGYPYYNIFEEYLKDSKASYQKYNSGCVLADQTHNIALLTNDKFKNFKELLVYFKSFRRSVVLLRISLLLGFYSIFGQCF